MRHYRNLVNESQSLTVFEMLNKLQDFLHEKHGIKSFGAKEDNGFIMFMSSYVTDEEGLHDKDLSEGIQSFVEKEFPDLKPITVHKDNYGYHIEFGENKQAAKLVEVTQAQGTGMADAKVSYKCHFCGKMEEGYGNDPWPLDTNPTNRVCNKCNDEVVIPARIEKLMKKESKNENADQKDVEASASNIVLDDKYTWLFSVLDENGRDVAEGIEYLQKAIEVLVQEGAAFLVAFPYVDPKPEDPDVEFVFADNPGPVMIYNNEEVTLDKADLERPTSETQPKPEDEPAEEEEEEMIEEALGRYVVHVYDVSLPGVRLDDDGEFTFTVKDITNIKFNIEQEIADRYGVSFEDIQSYEWEIDRLEENVKTGMSEEKLETYLMNALDIIQELTGLDTKTIEDDIIGTRGTLKVQLLNGMEYIQELTGEKMSEIENMLGSPMNMYLQLATDNSELKTEVTDEELEEAIQDVMEDEEMGQDYAVHATFTKEWYDYLEEMGVDDAKETIQNEEALAERLEEMLNDADIMVGFGKPYLFGTRHDLETTECSRENSLRAQEIIREFLGDWADVEIVSL